MHATPAETEHVLHLVEKANTAAAGRRASLIAIFLGLLAFPCGIYAQHTFGVINVQTTSQVDDIALSDDEKEFIRGMRKAVAGVSKDLPVERIVARTQELMELKDERLVARMEKRPRIAFGN